MKIPLNTNFMKLIDGSPKEIPAQDVFSGKKVVVCGVPGALTPVCSEQVSSSNPLVGIEPCRDVHTRYANDIHLNRCIYIFVAPSWVHKERGQLQTEG